MKQIEDYLNKFLCNELRLKKFFCDVCNQAKITPVFVDEPQTSRKQKKNKNKELFFNHETDEIAKQKGTFKENENIQKRKYKKEIVQYVPKFKQKKFRMCQIKLKKKRKNQLKEIVQKFKQVAQQLKNDQNE